MANSFLLLPVRFFSDLWVFTIFTIIFSLWGSNHETINCLISKDLIEFNCLLFLKEGSKEGSNVVMIHDRRRIWQKFVESWFAKIGNGIYGNNHGKSQWESVRQFDYYNLGVIWGNEGKANLSIKRWLELRTLMPRGISKGEAEKLRIKESRGRRMLIFSFFFL